MREIFLYLLLGHLQAAVGSVCVPVQCMKCNVTESVTTDPGCINETFPSNCTKDFEVSVNSTQPQPQEGDDVTLTCVNNLSDMILAFKWKKDGEEMAGQNNSILVLQKVFASHQGQYICIVNSTCGNYTSLPYILTVHSNSVVLLLVCGVGALVLVLSMGLAMKIKLKRDTDKHKERMNQRLQAGQRGGPAPLTPRRS